MGRMGGGIHSLQNPLPLVTAIHLLDTHRCYFAQATVWQLKLYIAPTPRALLVLGV